MAALVDADWLAARLEDPATVVVEVQYEPDIDDYSAGHIPGARHVFWKDLYWDPREREFLTPAQAAAVLGGLGAGPDSTLVLYSGRGQFATYGYWVFKQLNGHADVRVLNGGRGAWTRAGHPLTTTVPEVTPVPYPPAGRDRDDATRIYRQELLGLVGDPGTLLLDGRYPEEYHGERVKPGTGPDHGAERHGHIPGAVSLPFNSLLDDTFTLRPPGQLEALFRAAGAAPDQTARVVAYCRLGHRASLLWFAMRELLGWDHVRIYDGSWTEWGSTVGSPIEKEAR
ncbi:sulfurtransferase [Sphaerisporangium krabiense]|uniref:Sulfurtransferase n=1 Tax=Sphaerisporangium krabiense TaxID=763782 RepID=A0A7W9DU76_9ACTN|nr:sulfurtransferase [Sphaerisporangium krabiense]MBB5631388.1 thiosulfate/3-mercaptopyruvate sulfurtransferase [Sphaerisporangium krabiense]GII60806.1 sulfurtransferase [Sphaerisporangium krabiense]